MDEVVTEFSMEKLMTMPKGAWREFDSPMKPAIRRYAWKLIEIGRAAIFLTDFDKTLPLCIGNW